MTFKRLLILGGAALLVAGCSSDATSPVMPVGGTASVRGAAPKPRVPGMIQSMQASDSTVCRGSWPVVLGDGSVSCADEP